MKNVKTPAKRCNLLLRLRMSVLLCAVGKAVLVLGSDAPHEVGIEVQGIYVVKLFNPKTGTLHADSVFTNQFCVTLFNDIYALCVSNLHRKHSPMWEQVFFDGTNIYSLRFPSSRLGEKKTPSKENPVFVQILPGPYLLADLNFGWLNVEYPWLAYCFSPKRTIGGQDHITRFPIVGNRKNLSTTFGWSWEVKRTRCGNFVVSLRQIRDTSLNLSFRGELARPNTDCPNSLEDWREFVESLGDRRMFTNSFVRLEYNCFRVVCTNEWEVPAKGVFQLWEFPQMRRVMYKSEVAEISLLSLRLTTNKPRLPDVAIAFAEVKDYRYRRMRNDRIFNCATYTLKPGEPFRSANDPELLAQAERHLKWGRKYYQPPVSSRHKLLWLVAGVLVIPPVAYLWYRWRKTRQKSA